MDLCHAVFAYVGPETLMPATSILAAVCGFLLMFGRALFRPVVRLFRPVRAENTPPAAEVPITEIQSSS